MTAFHNRTRTSSSIPRRLIAEGRVYLLPLYGLLKLSDLAREGIENSGSYRFADHIYAGRPSGRLLVGRLLDALLLRMRSAESFRSRYYYAKDELRRFAATYRRRRAAAPARRETVDVAAGGLMVESGLDAAVAYDGLDVEAPPAAAPRMRILAVPCGLARELFELAVEWDEGGVEAELHGLDLDPELVELVTSAAARRGVDIRFHAGDALSTEAYPGTFDAVLSTGFTEFLDDEEVVSFYGIVFDRLRPGGWFITSGLNRDAASDFLLRHLAEIATHYRSVDDLRSLARRAGFTEITTYQDRHGLQTMMICGRSAMQP